MTTLQAELDRLYRCDPSAPDSTRAMVLELARPADWDALLPLWRGVQSDLELPAPAIAVNGNNGFQLWFSLAEAVSASEALAFLEGLRQRYLDTIASPRIQLWSRLPDTRMVPAQHPDSGCWSAFVAPDLASIFSEEPWLNMPPGQDPQALVLARIASIKPQAFRSVLQQIAATAATAKAAATATLPPSAEPGGTEREGVHLPALQFLQSVMNDTQVEMALRIEAAKALLAYRRGQSR